jgi:hypothetical protein
MKNGNKGKKIWKWGFFLFLDETGKFRGLPKHNEFLLGGPASAAETWTHQQQTDRQGEERGEKEPRRPQDLTEVRDPLALGFLY